MFFKFENEVMLKIISEDVIYSAKLLSQYKTSKVIDRKFTGHGFYTNYYIPDNIFSLGENINITLGKVTANLNDMKYGVGFVLFIKSGLITCLEGYAYNEPFPEIIYKYELK